MRVSGMLVNSICCITFVLFCAESFAEATIKADFANNVGAGQPGAGVSFYSGHVSDPTAISTSAVVGGCEVTGGHASTDNSCNVQTVLTQSAFGQIAGFNQPYPQYIDAAITGARDSLYSTLYEISANGAVQSDLPLGSVAERVEDPNQAAFRYLHRFYAEPTESIDPRSLTYSVLDFWDEPLPDNDGNVSGENRELQRALNQAADLRAALKYQPTDPRLIHDLLDVYYYIALAYKMVGKEYQFNANRAAMRLGPDLSEATDFPAFAISKEIEFLELAVRYYERAPKEYFELMFDPMGVNTGDVLGESDVPYGYTLLRDYVPERGLYSPVDSFGALVSVVSAPAGNLPNLAGNAPLFAGYKDLVLLLELEERLTSTAATLARLYKLRNNPENPGPANPEASDVEKAKVLIDRVQARSLEQLRLLTRLFQESRINTFALENPLTGMNEARIAVNRGLSNLGNVRSFLDGDANIFGFDETLLVLKREEFDVSGVNLRTSYDVYFDELTVSRSQTIPSKLQQAVDAYEVGQNAYQNYLSTVDGVEDQIEGQRSQFFSRLGQIVGAAPPANLVAESSHPYFNPELQNGEIRIQLLNIQSATNQIGKNGQQIANLEEQILIEQQRRAVEAGVAQAIADTYVRYGEKQAKIAEEIAEINAVQAAASAVASAGGLGKLFSGESNAQLANGVIQVGGELLKGRLNAQSQRLAAQQSSDISLLQDDLSEANSDARIKELLLQMKTLAYDSTEAVIVLQREQARLTGLYDEKERLEAEWIRANSSLANRYYADPSHRYILLRDVITAQAVFEQTAVDIYLMARAAEYKWNQKFVGVFGNESYSIETLSKIRNAQELNNFVIALSNWDNGQDASGSSERVVLSLREDILGYRDTANLRTLMYPDPLDSDGPLVNSLTAFRNYLTLLSQEQPLSPPDDFIELSDDFDEVLPLSFSTANPDANADLFSRGVWNEKIVQLALRARGTFDESEYDIGLRAGGTGLLRREVRGYVPPGADVTRCVDELRSFPLIQRTRSDRDGNAATPDTWGDSFYQLAIKTPTISSLPETFVKIFSELPVAISNWNMFIPLTNRDGTPAITINTLQDIEIHMDVYALRPRTSSTAGSICI